MKQRSHQLQSSQSLSLSSTDTVHPLPPAGSSVTFQITSAAPSAPTLLLGASASLPLDAACSSTLCGSSSGGSSGGDGGAVRDAAASSPPPPPPVRGGAQGAVIPAMPGG